jgi:hypothetical protein
MVNKEKYLKVVREWKFNWMNQTQNDPADFKNYHDRAFGIDSNMMHDLAQRLVNWENFNDGQSPIRLTQKISELETENANLKDQIEGYKTTIRNLLSNK